jgi:hypothetical protein
VLTSLTKIQQYEIVVTGIRIIYTQQQANMGNDYYYDNYDSEPDPESKDDYDYDGPKIQVVAMIAVTGKSHLLSSEIE